MNSRVFFICTIFFPVVSWPTFKTKKDAQKSPITYSFLQVSQKPLCKKPAILGANSLKSFKTAKKGPITSRCFYTWRLAQKAKIITQQKNQLKLLQDSNEKLRKENANWHEQCRALTQTVEAQNQKMYCLRVQLTESANSLELRKALAWFLHPNQKTIENNENENDYDDDF